MKKIFFLVFILAAIFGAPYLALARHKPTTTISAVRKNDKTIEFTLSSSSPFIVGNNVYVLSIGDKQFAHSRQSSANGIGTLTFLIPENDFNTLNDGVAIYLTYGHLFKGTPQNMEELCKKDNLPCWSLGSFSKDILNK